MFQKTIDERLSLAIWAEMCTPSGHQNSPNCRLADAAGKPRPLVHAVLKLEESANPVGVNIIRRLSRESQILVSTRLSALLQKGWSAFEMAWFKRVR